jgi:Flp pilus assembly protein TadD
MRLLVVVLLVAQATHLVLRRDPRDGLREADGLLAAGRYYDALHAYSELASSNSQWPEPALRVGVVRELRGEHVLAVRALYDALAAGLRGPQRDLALVYLGHALLAAGESQRAERMWAQVRPTSAYAPLLLVLRGEQALLAGDNDAATGLYRAALAPSLPPAWWALATYRLALLRGATDGSAALAELQPPSTQVATAQNVDALLVRPLLPPVVPADGQLATILRAAPDERAQMLGQLYLELGLYQLARLQFDRVTAGSPLVLSAQTYGAYARLRSGDRAGGLTQLQEIVRQHPDDSRARTLLALSYMADAQLAQAERQIMTLETQPGQQVQAQLAWATWRSANRDYIGAMATYQQLIAQADSAQRGQYALLAARFHLTTGFEICSGGLDAADIAARELPNDVEVQTVLAGSRLYCADPGGAAIAARAALALAPRADAAYYLGAALAVQGERAAARAALIRAADLAPDSSWRERAEQVIAGL